MKTSMLRSVSLLALASAALSASAQNLVVNPSLESSLGDYSTSGDVNLSTFLRTPNGSTFAQSGNAFALLGFNGGAASLSQSLATQAGASYEVSFFLKAVSPSAGNPPIPATFLASFGGQTLLSLTNRPGNADYVRYSFSVLSASGNDSLTFTKDGNVGLFALDGLSVTRISPSVPGPMAALPFALMALKRRKRS